MFFRSLLTCSKAEIWRTIFYYYKFHRSIDFVVSTITITIKWPRCTPFWRVSILVECHFDCIYILQNGPVSTQINLRASKEWLWFLGVRYMSSSVLLDSITCTPWSKSWDAIFSRSIPSVETRRIFSSPLIL